MELEDSLTGRVGSEEGDSTLNRFDLTRSMHLTMEAHFRVGNAYQILNKPSPDIDKLMRYLGEAVTMYEKALEFSPANESARTGIDTVKRLKQEVIERVNSCPNYTAEISEHGCVNGYPSLYILVETSNADEKTRGLKNAAGINAAATVFHSTESLSGDNLGAGSEIEQQLMNYSGIDKLTILHMVTLLRNLGYSGEGASIRGVYTKPVKNISRNQALHQIPVEEIRNYLLS